MFVCFVTKALHLEAVLNFTANTFRAAFKRKNGRQGALDKVYRDDAFNFTEANQRWLNFVNSF